MPDAGELRSVIRVFLLSYAMISLVGGMMSGYGWVFFGVFLCLFFWATYLLHFNESFLSYIYTAFFSVIAIFALFCAMAMYFSYFEWFGRDTPGALFVSASTIILFVILLVLAHLSKVHIDIFEFKDNRVKIINSTGSKSQMGIVVLIGGASTLIAKSVYGAIGPKFTITLCGVFSLVLVIHMITRLRNVMANLRVLRLKQRKTGVSYVFMQIDDIRQARTRWWTPRVLKWLASLRHAFT